MHRQRQLHHEEWQDHTRRKLALASSKESTNCYNGNTWDTTACPDNKACATNCAIDGADYSGTYGITASSNSLKLKFITKGSYSTNIGSRTYLMKDDSTYEMFKFTGNQEFTFDVDLSNLPCGFNGALYFVSMDADGGMKKYSTNKAGAKYGWQPSSNDKNAGVGGYGSCCAEMDIWEANSVSTAVTPHSCSTIEQARCSGDTCGGTYSADRYAGTCDPDGCDFNSYRMGVKDFYGKGKTVDTSKKFTIVTQFIGTGDNMEIKRFYVQGGKTIPQPASAIPGVDGNSITTKFCDQQKAVFGDRYTFKEKGGMANMAKALANGMVLVMSLWDDHNSNMLWLDSTYPTDKNPDTDLGSARGECETTSGAPADVESKYPDATVTYSNIKFGPLNSTFG
ncbi:Glyco-hydro-7 multi-domain protein [Pyrenophora tritici-repentis]|nr:Glyco-hydro-7 multi-domain protein [Pyrenophora tritici-repentis]KAI0573943.1 Glyco-hydro-7 multi-domain protein [Pyrenophora tritici-repentis]KAI0577793.1 Glyco-hydro-7 multi-domain protein [Pyrenophora tritici-repentis]KAI0605437.1 Glyco-hydro-7 multi-domain protein [Pyrenophora tritici-repentis]KAI0618107.1 Glyco-hydro-7 multi-domain protein [Pyrenophora tritici-repentis]